MLCNTILCGLHNVKHQVQLAIMDYWPYSDELSVADGVIFRGIRVVIPHAMRPEMVRKSHEAHQGIEATKKLAWDVIILYWPRMEHGVIFHGGCMQGLWDYIRNLHKISLQNRCCHIPLLNFHFRCCRVSSHIFEFQGEYYLVIVNYNSDYFEVERVPDLTTGNTHGANHRQWLKLYITGV